MTSRQALEFLTEGICNCPQCSKYVECMDLDESESVCENAKFIIIKDLKRLEQLEKELKQTKLNFKNSQIHSKNCYKKLKEKYTRLERAYKNNEVLVRDLNELINRNLELKKENQELKASYESLIKENHKLSIENNNSKIVEEMNKTVVENKNKQLLEATELNITYLDKIIMLKKAIKILKDALGLYLVNKKFGKKIVYALMSKTLGMCLLNPTKKQYELLEEVLGSVGEE